MPDDVRDALERFHEDQVTQWSDRQVIAVALRQFLEALGYMKPETLALQQQAATAPEAPKKDEVES